MVENGQLTVDSVKLWPGVATDGHPQISHIWILQKGTTPSDLFGQLCGSWILIVNINSNHSEI